MKINSLFNGDIYFDFSDEKMNWYYVLNGNWNWNILGTYGGNSLCRKGVMELKWR